MSDSERFLLDVMLGKLATYLPMCGYDPAYALDRGIEGDDAIRSLAAAENRTLLTRDEQLAERADDALLLTERDIEDQLRELRAAGVPLSLPERPQRCSACNGRVERVDDAEDRPEHVPDGVDGYRCRAVDSGSGEDHTGTTCGRRSRADYWRGL